MCSQVKYKNRQNMMFRLVVDTNNCQQQTKKQTQNTAAGNKCFTWALAGVIPSCIENISFVAFLSITALCFAFSGRHVSNWAYLGYVSFFKLFTGTVNCAVFVKRFAFRRSIVEYCVHLEAWVGVVALSQFSSFLAVFVRLRTGAEITLSRLNTCGDSMIWLIY